MRVDINQPQQLDAALDGVQLVFNAVGPFYRSALPVVEAALRNRVDYIDINDDHDVAEADRKSTRLNSSHVRISYAVFCLKKKKKNEDMNCIVTQSKKITR